MARAESVVIEKHGRKVVVAVEKYDRLRALEAEASGRSKRKSEVGAHEGATAFAE